CMAPWRGLLPGRVLVQKPDFRCILRPQTAGAGVRIRTLGTVCGSRDQQTNFADLRTEPLNSSTEKKTLYRAYHSHTRSAEPVVLPETKVQRSKRQRSCRYEGRYASYPDDWLPSIITMMALHMVVPIATVVQVPSPMRHVPSTDGSDRLPDSKPPH